MCGKVRERPLRERARRSRGDRDEGLSLSVVLFSMSCVRRPWRRSRRPLAARRMGMRSPQTMACASLPTRPCAWPWRPNELSGRMAAYGHEGAARYRENAAPDGFQMSQGQPGGSREPKGDAWGQSSSGHEGGTEVGTGKVCTGNCQVVHDDGAASKAPYAPVGPTGRQMPVGGPFHVGRWASPSYAGDAGTGLRVPWSWA